MTEHEWLTSTDSEAMLTHALTLTNKPSPRKLRLFACAACWLIEPTQRNFSSRRPLHKAFIKAVESHADGLGELPIGTEWAVNPDPKAGALEAIVSTRPQWKTDWLLREILGNLFRPVVVRHASVCWSCSGHKTVRVYRGEPSQGSDHGPCHTCNATGRLGGNEDWLTPTVLSLSQAAYERPQKPCKKCHGTGNELVPDHGSTMTGSTSAAWAVRYVPVVNTTCSECRGDRCFEDGQLDRDNLSVLADALEDAGAQGKRCPGCSGEGRVWVLGTPYDSGSWERCEACLGEKYLPNPLVEHLRSAGPHYKGCWAVDLVLGKN